MRDQQRFANTARFQCRVHWQTREPAIAFIKTIKGLHARRQYQHVLKHVLQIQPSRSSSEGQEQRANSEAERSDN